MWDYVFHLIELARSRSKGMEAGGYEVGRWQVCGPVEGQGLFT